MVKRLKLMINKYLFGTFLFFLYLFYNWCRNLWRRLCNAAAHTRPGCEHPRLDQRTGIHRHHSHFPNDPGSYRHQLCHIHRLHGAQQQRRLPIPLRPRLIHGHGCRRSPLLPDCAGNVLRLEEIQRKHHI